MATELTTQTSEPAQLIPAAKLSDIQKLDQILVESRRIIEDASPMTKAFATAAAMRELEAAITDEMMADIMNLMDSQLGFKTDRKPGSKDRNGNKIEPYKPFVVKRVVIVALLAGASMTGNEFNILVSQCYFTKEFVEKCILGFPGLTDFEMQLSPPLVGQGKTAVMDGVATWKVNGQPYKIVCKKRDASNDEDMISDTRLLVNAYATSSPDQLRGLGESKLLRRVWAKLNGLNIENQTANDDSEVIDGMIKSPVMIDHDSPEETKPEPKSQSSESQSTDGLTQGQKVWMNERLSKIRSLKTVGFIEKKATDAFKELDDSGWDSSVVEELKNRIDEAKFERISEIKGD